MRHGHFALMVRWTSNRLVANTGLLQSKLFYVLFTLSLTQFGVAELPTPCIGSWQDSSRCDGGCKSFF